VLPSLTRTVLEFSYFLVIGWAPGHNAPLSPFLISALFILFACLYCMVPHLSFFALFPYLSPPLLIFSLRIDPLHFLAGCRKRRLNLAVVFVFILCCGTFLWVVNACICCVRFSFFITIPKDSLGEMSSK